MFKNKIHNNIVCIVLRNDKSVNKIPAKTTETSCYTTKRYDFSYYTFQCNITL